MKKLIIMSCLAITYSCSNSTVEIKPNTQSEPPQKEYRCDSQAAESLYNIARLYGIGMPFGEFLYRMEDPILAEKFLMNLLDEGILDSKKDVRFWLMRLYKDFPKELKHLDLAEPIRYPARVVDIFGDDSGGTNNGYVPNLGF